MADRTDATGAIIELAPLPIGREFPNRARPNRPADRQDERSGPENTDRNKSVDRIVIDLLNFRYDRKLRCGTEQERMTVRRRLRHIGGRYCARRTDPVLNDKRPF